MLVVPIAWTSDTIGNRIVVAWNASKEARRATTDALPLLSTARSVKILIVDAAGNARAQMDERRQLEMQLPGDRRKEFLISIDTAHVRGADPNSARNFELVVARCGRGGRGEGGGRYFVTSSTDQRAIRDRAFHALRVVGYRGFGDVTVISDGAEILKRLPAPCPNRRPTSSTGFILP